MDDRPVGKAVTCPWCEGTAFAIVPRGSTIVDRDDIADGKVQVTCRTCEKRFLAHYSIGR